MMWLWIPSFNAYVLHALLKFTLHVPQLINYGTVGRDALASRSHTVLVCRNTVMQPSVRRRAIKNRLRDIFFGAQ